ncbi:MAG TPA: hypothetical protein VLY46_10835 [Usitatibacter sp.]|nr:hypothetical protein [Usitatibacter sp.]
MKRVLVSVAALALGAAAAGCHPPVEKSEFNNSGLSVAIAGNPSLAAHAANPPPRIVPPNVASLRSQPAPSAQEEGGAQG